MDKEIKEVKSTNDIPKDMTDDESAEFWGEHGLSEELLEESIIEDDPEDLTLPKSPKTKPVPIRFDDDVLNRLKEVAKRKNKGYQTLLKEFVSERLYEEEKRMGIL